MLAKLASAIILAARLRARQGIDMEFNLRSMALLVLSAIIVAACTAAPRRPAPTPTPARPPDLSWEGSIGPLLNDRCASCHGQVAGISYATYESALRGGMNGPIILPGKPADSKLIVKQSQGDHPGQLSPEQLARVKEWIRWGAPEK
jgi:mono/diheme cytochrome c family protein